VSRFLTANQLIKGH